MILPLVLAAILLIFHKICLYKHAMILHAIANAGAGIFLYFYPEQYPGYFSTDAYGLLFFGIIAVLYLAAAVYSYAFMPNAKDMRHRLFGICMMLFVFAMNGAVFASNLGLVWVFVETTTLASAILIFHQQNPSALEAAWKYIFICSVGIALAFVGMLLLLIAMPHGSDLSFEALRSGARATNSVWLRMAFVFLLCGFGTKLGLAPLHFWLPDAHSEAVAPVSALLSGALLNTALLPILRMREVMQIGGEAGLYQNLMLLMGCLSVFVATVYIPRIKNYKRILAYSSIENMGIITIAIALGSVAQSAGFIHLLGHSLIKSALFLLAGNIYILYNDKNVNAVKALYFTHKPTAILWILGFVLISGLPPSPLFFSEVQLFFALVTSGKWYLAVLLAAMLSTIIYAMAKMTLQMCFGEKADGKSLKAALYIPSTLLMVLAVIAGFWYMAAFLS